MGRSFFASLIGTLVRFCPALQNITSHFTGWAIPVCLSGNTFSLFSPTGRRHEKAIRGPVNVLDVPPLFRPGFHQARAW